MVASTQDRALAALVVLLAWWASTGVVLRLVWSKRSTFPVSLATLSVLAVGALVGARYTAALDSPAAAYAAFGCALVLWAWHELAFLLGFVTGPRRVPCPADVDGWTRFRLGVAVVIHHELALFATQLALVALTWGQPNQVGTWTFAVLFVMRLSAKLNVFLGVRNLTTDFVPPQLRYLVSYFRRSRFNPLMPASIVGAGLGVVSLSTDALAETTPFVAVSRTLVATLLGLGLLEHGFLALPLPDAVLWRWVLKKQGKSDLARSP